MEFKVWMDGIQRVVCGVSYDTTCQEVVFALASAMGRTGHFTLVEKWRDSERSLISAECPLKSLQNRGEYSGEVRYYLVQAETDRVKQQEKSNQKMKVSEQQKPTFLQNITPSETLQCHLHSLKSELIKRSSTFSGAHKSVYETLPSSLSKSSTSATLSQHSSNKQTFVPSSLICTAREYHLGSTSASKGKLASISPTSTSSSFTGSSYTSRETSSDHVLNSPSIFCGDERGLHPVIKPEALSSHYRPYSSHTQYPSKHFNPVPSQQSVSPHPTQHPNLGQTLQHLTSSSNANYSSSAWENNPTAITAAHFCHSQLPPSSEMSYPQSKKSYQQTCPTPAPRHKTMLTSTAGDQESPHGQKSPKQTEKLHDRNLCVPVCIPSTTGGHARSVSNEGIEKNIQNVASINVSPNNHTQIGQDGTALHPNQGSRTEMTRGYQHFSNNRISQNLNCCDRIIQRKLKSEDISESSADSKEDLFTSAIPDRPYTRPSPGFYNKSLSGGTENEQTKLDEGQLMKQEQTSDRDQLQQSKEDRKLKAVKSFFMKQQLFDIDGNNNRTMSTFVSAVAHIRQHCGGAKWKLSKAGTHVRQHSLDSSKTDASFKGGLTDSARLPSGQKKKCVGDFNSSTNIHSNYQQCRDHLLQQSNRSSISSSWQNSAFKELCTNLSHQESSLFPSHESEPCNTDNENSKLRDFGCVIGNVSSSHPNEESFHSRRVSMDSEDKSYQGVSKRDTSGSENAKGGQQPSMLAEHGLEVDITSSQADNEHSQLLKLVKRQQEKMKLQKAHLTDVNLEINNHEDEESNDKAKLEEILQEVFTLEIREVNFKMELENLGMTEWISVLDQENKLETNLKLQIGSLQENLKKIESQIQQLKKEESTISKVLKSEEERIIKEKIDNEELEELVNREVKHLEDHLASLSITTDQNNQIIKEMERKILKEDTDLNQKEINIKSMKDDLNNEAQKPSSISVRPVIPVLAASSTAIPISASGEAILKILDSRLSAHASQTSATRYEAVHLNGVLSAQHLYKSAMTVKNSSGVWV